MPDSYRAAASDATTTDCSKNQTLTPYDALLTDIDNTTVILTPNRRLAATLHKRYAARQSGASHLCWQTPDIIPAISWINRLWHDIASQSFDSFPYLLTPSQEQILWEMILRQSKENPLLLQITETASTIHAAWGLLKQWQIPLDHPSLSSSDDYASMKHWAQTFQSLCQQRHWIDDASLPDFLVTSIKQGGVTLPSRIVLTGFTDLSPQMTALLNACREHGCHVTEYTPSENTLTTINRCQLPDRDTEIKTIARWAKATLDRHPGATIGCVIPTLDEVRDQAEQVFSDVFMQSDKQDASAYLPFNISAGKPIAHYPVIQAALSLLMLVKITISIDNFNQILMMPFMGEAETERVKRAKLDSILRKSNMITVDIKQILHAENLPIPSLQQFCPHLAKRLADFVALLSSCETFQTHHEWVNFITSALEILGWPGERSINSEEYQAIQRWLSLLLEYKQFDKVSTPVSIADAIDRLRQLASKTFYQPQTPEAPVQILGLLEAAALPFDYLWVSGMDDIAWPPAPKPNPFIPKQLQRERQMPHATAERELTFCSRVMSQFSSTAGTLFYSHAIKNDKIELQVSPLTRSFPTVDLAGWHLPSHQALWEQLFQSKKMEVITDTHGPEIRGNQKNIGGVKILQNQAVCPFKAFAEHRLHAHDIEIPVPGLRAKDRGNMIHQIMEYIWSILKDHTTLVAQTDDDLRVLIDSAIKLALQSDSNSRAIYQNYTQLEYKRLQKLIWQWMQIEKMRDPFAVAGNEVKTDIQLDQLVFSCKIDRIDQLNDQQFLIIDYKTGKNNDYKYWFGDRPDEPQLPIYALSHPAVAAICYAQINAAESGWIGVGNDDVHVDGIKPLNEIKLAASLKWDNQLNDWKIILTTLANDFVAGKAVVDPKDTNKSCEYCTLQPFCRIHEENPCAA